ncbi:MAG: hydrogenase expression/formation protein HypE [Sedimentisphaerales bacterium]|nr:hydrogenase expression/formation protein HypE [Sedimentisphaerales bacterium]
MANKEPQKILLAHGGGGRLTANLIEKTILPKLANEVLNRLTDGAVLRVNGASLCFTTDSYVVQPLFFNGGDIGKLAVCGTINDLSAMGARPIALSLALIIEEGFPMEILDRVLDSVGRTSQEAGVPVVTGDTKVVESEAADGLFINTAGIGVLLPNVNLSFERIQPGDKIIINGTIGDHGMTILSRRKGIRFDSPLKSDCSALADLTSRILEAVPGVKFMRDPTRGGVAAILNEIAAGAGCDVVIEETALPIDPTVRAAAEMLGLDVLEIANEGKMLMIVASEDAKEVVRICRDHTLGAQAAVIGTVATPQEEGGGIVELLTKIGGRRIVQMPYGRELPRIC